MLIELPSCTARNARAVTLLRAVRDSRQENRTQMRSQHKIWTSIKIWGGGIKPKCSLEIKCRNSEHLSNRMRSQWKKQDKMYAFGSGSLQIRWEGPGEPKTLAANAKNNGMTNGVGRKERALTKTKKLLGRLCPLDSFTLNGLSSTPKTAFRTITATSKQMSEHPTSRTGLSSLTLVYTQSNHISGHPSTKKETLLSQLTSF